MFFAWVVIGLLLSLARQRGLHIAIQAPVLLWILVPQAAGYSLSSIDGIHPSAILVITVYIVWLVTGRVGILRSGRRTLPIWFLLLSAGFPVFLISTLLSAGSSGLRLYLDLVGAPMLWILMFLSAFSVDKAARDRVLAGFVVSASVSSVIGILQVVTGSVLVYHSSYASIYWFQEDVQRAIGTSDSPVTLAFTLVVGIILTAWIKRYLVRFMAVVVMGAAVVLTGSRVGVVLAIIGVVYSLVFRGRRIGLGQILMASSAGLLVAFAYQSGFADRLLSRIADDNGSARLRAQATDYFFGHLSEVVVLGHGSGQASLLRTSQVLESSLENGLYIYAYEYGLILTLILVLIQLILVLRRSLLARSVSGVLLWVVGMAGVTASSSIGASGSAAAVWWVAFGFAMTVPKRRKVQSTAESDPSATPKASGILSSDKESV